LEAARMGQPMPGQVGTMAGADAMRERIEGKRCLRATLRAGRGDNA
jgi:hypothetical protein